MNWKIKACEVFYSPCLFFPHLQPHEMGEEGIPTSVEENPKLIWLQGRYTCIDKNIKFGPQFFSIAWQLLHLQEVENCFHWGVRICGRGETLVDFSSASCRLLSGKSLTRLKSSLKGSAGSQGENHFCWAQTASANTLPLCTPPALGPGSLHGGILSTTACGGITLLTHSETQSYLNSHGWKGHQEKVQSIIAGIPTFQYFWG